MAQANRKDGDECPTENALQRAVSWERQRLAGEFLSAPVARPADETSALPGLPITFGHPPAMTVDNNTTTIIAMERAALDRWGKGDPSGFLEICAPDVVYFDNTLERRLDGLEALTSLYDKIRGQIHMDRYDLLNPKVQLCGEVAVLTYNFVGYAEGKAHRWNCTEVYRRTANGWRIIQTHWSLTQSIRS